MNIVLDINVSVKMVILCLFKICLFWKIYNCFIIVLNVLDYCLKSVLFLCIFIEKNKKFKFFFGIKEFWKGILILVLNEFFKWF